MRALRMLAIGAASAALFVSGAVAATGWTTVDGDTIRKGRETVRLYGIDAPEWFHPRCQAERDKAIAAASEVQRLIAEAKRVTVHRRKTRAGKPIRDKYGRTLAVVKAGSTDIGAHLLGMGLAAPYLGSGPRRDWCNGG